MSRNTILYVETPVLRSELAGEPVGEYERTGERQFFDIRPLSGREYVQAQQVQSTATHELRCVYFAGANTSMRLTAGESETPTRVFNVESVVNDNENNRSLVWRCQEVT
jgi:SPP1 family predicted phage head-tail adaptor